MKISPKSNAKSTSDASIGLYTLLETNIFPEKSILKMILLFPFGGVCDRSLRGYLQTHLFPANLPFLPQDLGGQAGECLDAVQTETFAVLTAVRLGDDGGVAFGEIFSENCKSFEGILEVGQFLKTALQILKLSKTHFTI